MSLNLDRFIKAQKESLPADLSELEKGAEPTHWIWFIFPQLRGLGNSQKALFYAPTSSAWDILGNPDNLKFRSCMTLFSMVAPDEILWHQALNLFFAGKADPVTLDRLRKSPTD